MSEYNESHLDQLLPNAGLNHNIKSSNIFFEHVGKLIYLEMIVINQNLIQVEIKNRLNSGNACYCLVQNLLSSCLLPKDVYIQIYISIILPIVLYGHETLSLR
jgi:hypothetical protein